MARFTATWTNTDESDWEGADLIRTNKIQDHVGQNIEHLAQTHQHRRDTANDGDPLVLEHVDEILFRMS